MTFRLRYFLIFLIVLATEILIALFVRDNFIRPYLGDLLVVVLIYAFVRAFFRISVKPAAALVLAFAFFVELMQYMDIVDALGLRGNKAARIAIGMSFSWEDLAMYVLGTALVLFAEMWFARASSGGGAAKTP